MIRFSKDSVTLIVILSLFLVTGLICSKAKHDDIKDNRKVIFTPIYDITLSQYGYPQLHVKFKYNNKLYYESRSFANLSYAKSRKYILGKKVGVAFSSKNPSNIEILITSSSFEDAGLEMPDSCKILFKKIKSSW